MGLRLCRSCESADYFQNKSSWFPGGAAQIYESWMFLPSLSRCCFTFRLSPSAQTFWKRQPVAGSQGAAGSSGSGCISFFSSSAANTANGSEQWLRDNMDLRRSGDLESEGAPWRRCVLNFANQSESAGDQDGSSNICWSLFTRSQLVYEKKHPSTVSTVNRT